MDVDGAIQATRNRFVDTFRERHQSLCQLAEELNGEDRAEALTGLRNAVHRIAGLGGIVGLPTLSVRAQDLELLLLDEGEINLDAVRAKLSELQSAFEQDLEQPTPGGSVTPPSGDRVKVVLVEDDPDQRQFISSALERAGHAVSSVDRGDLAFETVRTQRPDAVVLDVNLPGLDGFSLCRQLKADPALKSTPVIFVTSRAGLADRVNGLTLGADDYLVKPVDAAELQLRLDLVLRRRAAMVPAVSGGVLEYESFVREAGDELRAGPLALALVRLPRGRFEALSVALALNLRRRDMLGRYDDSHLLILFPGFTAAAAAACLQDLAGSLQQKGERIFAGVAASARTTATDPVAFDAMMNMADEALAAARYAGEAVAVHGDGHQPSKTAARRTIVVAEDEPDIARVLDSQLKNAGYDTRLAFDGRQALELIQTAAPDAAILDLMMPGLTGFDVLGHLRTLPEPRPRLMVISARGREGDVTRAFALGADDYLMKPFSPQELLARLSRLLR